MTTAEIAMLINGAIGAAVTAYLAKRQPAKATLDDTHTAVGAISEKLDSLHNKVDDQGRRIARLEDSVWPARDERATPLKIQRRLRQ